MFPTVKTNRPLDQNLNAKSCKALTCLEYKSWENNWVLPASQGPQIKIDLPFFPLLSKKTIRTMTSVMARTASVTYKGMCWFWKEEIIIYKYVRNLKISHFGKAQTKMNLDLMLVEMVLCWTWYELSASTPLMIRVDFQYFKFYNLYVLRRDFIYFEMWRVLRYIKKRYEPAWPSCKVWNARAAKQES